MISWPIAHDQPLLANWLTVDKDVSFELLQVRDDICIGKPVHRSPGTIVEGTSSAIRLEARHVFEAMRGEEGERKRANMKKLQADLKESHNSGESYKTLLRLAYLENEVFSKVKE